MQASVFVNENDPVPFNIQVKEVAFYLSSLSSSTSEAIIIFNGKVAFLSCMHFFIHVVNRRQDGRQRKGARSHTTSCLFSLNPGSQSRIYLCLIFSKLSHPFNIH